MVRHKSAGRSLERLAAGDKKVFEAIYNQYKYAVYANIRKLIHDAEAAEDITQETFIKFWQKRSALNSINDVGAWLFTVSYHQSIDYINRKIKESGIIDFVPDIPEHTLYFEEDNSIEETFRIQLLQIKEAVEILPARKKEIFELFRFEGKSYEEIAAITGISVQSVKDYLKQSTALIRKYIQSRAGQIPHTSYIILLFLVSGYLI